MKTRFFMLFAALLLSSASAFAQSGNNEPVKGDVNGDGTVDVADIAAVIRIMRGGGGIVPVSDFFYLGITEPTVKNYKVLPGIITSYTSIDDALETIVTVGAGETLYMLCPTAWMTEKSVIVKDASGKSFNFLDEIDDTSIPGHSIYRTQVWDEASTLTLKAPDPIIPYVGLNFDVYWNYFDYFGISYDWQAEWIYGWDEEDKAMFGEIGYTEPTEYNVRRYKTDAPYGPHTSVLSNTVKGTSLFASWDFGYWDILAWSAGETSDIPSLRINETLDGVTAYTNWAYHYAPWASGSARSYYPPEQLFSGYAQAIEINENLDGFVYDEERSVFEKKLYMTLQPMTYIYLTQIILHNNRNKIISVDGDADLSGMARSTNLFTGVADNDPVNLLYNIGFKRSVTMPQTGETVAVVGGRLMTFGIPGQNGNRIRDYSEVTDTQEHYLGINMQFYNGMDSTFVFNVTDQVRRRWKGGIITVQLDMDTVSVPVRHY